MTSQLPDYATLEAHILRLNLASVLRWLWNWNRLSRRGSIARPVKFAVPQPHSHLPVSNQGQPIDPIWHRWRYTFTPLRR